MFATQLRSALRRVAVFVRHKVLAGLVVLFPLSVTVWVVIQLLAFLDGLIGRYLDFPGLGIAALFLVLLLVGTLVTSFVGHKAFQLYDRLLSRLPLARVLYVSTRQLVEAFTPGGGRSFQRVVLIEYPGPGTWALAFLTREGVGEVAGRGSGPLSCVFLPTTPNPTSGFLLLLPQDRIVPIDLPVEEGIQMIVSAGLVAPSNMRFGAAAVTVSAPPAPPSAG